MESPDVGSRRHDPVVPRKVRDADRRGGRPRRRRQDDARRAARRRARCAGRYTRTTSRGWDNPVDWWPALLEQVLEPLAAGRAARFTPTSWGGPPRDEVVVEPGPFRRRRGRDGVAGRVPAVPLVCHLGRGAARRSGSSAASRRGGDDTRERWGQWMAAEDDVRRARAARRARGPRGAGRRPVVRERRARPPGQGRDRHRRRARDRPRARAGARRGRARASSSTTSAARSTARARTRRPRSRSSTRSSPPAARRSRTTTTSPTSPPPST